jgi:hypothetical protein
MVGFNKKHKIIISILNTFSSLAKAVIFLGGGRFIFGNYFNSFCAISALQTTRFIVLYYMAKNEIL